MAKGDDSNNESGDKQESSECGPDLEMFENWVQKYYGENSRTKTITGDKHTRICQLIRGEDKNTNAKFRFWVKSKGFRLINHDKDTNEVKDDPEGNLVVSLHAKEDTAPAAGESIESFLRTNLPEISFFRKVATVEEFYDIIKSVHIDGKGVHAGQKKTYRLVSDTYAFLPREVITYYLLNCNTCKPRIQKYGPIHTKLKLYNHAAANMKKAITSSKFANEFQMPMLDPESLVKVIRPAPKRYMPPNLSGFFPGGYGGNSPIPQKNVWLKNGAQKGDEPPTGNGFQSVSYQSQSMSSEDMRNIRPTEMSSTTYPSHSVADILSKPTEKTLPPFSAAAAINAMFQNGDPMANFNNKTLEKTAAKTLENYANLYKREEMLASNEEKKQQQQAYAEKFPSYDCKDINLNPDAPAACVNSCCSPPKLNFNSYDKMKTERFYGNRMEPYKLFQKDDSIRNLIAQRAEASDKNNLLSAPYNDFNYLRGDKRMLMEFYARNGSNRYNLSPSPSFWTKRMATGGPEARLESWKFLKDRALEKTQCIPNC